MSFLCIFVGQLRQNYNKTNAISGLIHPLVCYILSFLKSDRITRIVQYNFKLSYKSSFIKRQDHIAERLIKKTINTKYNNCPMYIYMFRNVKYHILVLSAVNSISQICKIETDFVLFPFFVDEFFNLAFVNKIIIINK